MDFRICFTVVSPELEEDDIGESLACSPGVPAAGVFKLLDNIILRT